MAQRIVELLIGRLITDEQFRAEFLDDPKRTLTTIRDHGFELSQTEIAALIATDRALWRNAAELLDPRLQKANLNTPVSDEENTHHV